MGNPKAFVGLGLVGFAVVIAGLWARLNTLSEDSTTTPPVVRSSPRGALPLLGGCRRVLRGGVCEVTAGDSLRLWIRTIADGTQVCLPQGVQLSSNASATASRPPRCRGLRSLTRAEHGGFVLSLRVVRAGGEITIEREGTESWRTRFAAHTQPQFWEAALSAHTAGDSAQLRRVLAAAEPLAGREALLAKGLLARSALHRGDTGAAAHMLSASAAGLRELGLVSDAGRDIFARFFILLNRDFDLPAARQALDDFRTEATEYPSGTALMAEHEGMLREAEGDLAQALRDYERAERVYERLGQQSDRGRLRERQALLLGELGLVRQAHQRHSELIPPQAELSPCDRAAVWVTQSWLALLRVESGDGQLEASTTAALARAEEAAAACGDPSVALGSWLNQARWALRRNDASALKRLKRRLDGVAPSRAPFLSVEQAEVRARFALIDGNLDQADAAFSEEGAQGRVAGLLDAELRAALGRAEVAVARRQRDAAKTHLERALSLLTRSQQLAPLGALGHTHYAARHRSAQRLVELLLADGDRERAFAVALQSYRTPLQLRASSHARAALTEERRQEYDALLARYRQSRQRLTGEAERDWARTAPVRRVAREARHEELAELWGLLERAERLLAGPDPTEPLPPLPAGQQRLLVFPLETQWAVFRQSATTLDSLVMARSASAPEPSDLARILRPLASSSRILVMPAGAAAGWDFQQLLTAGGHASPAPIVFSLGLTRAPKPPESAPTAGLVVDPRSDLRFARLEGELVQRTLHPSSSNTLWQEQAGPSPVMGLLERADFLHYAGHARAARADSTAALLLSDGTELSAWELFGLQRVPRQVVLSACESASGGGQGLAAGWGLAQVLIARGADAVLAPIQEETDASSFRLQRRIYAALQGSTDLEAAFFQARSELGPELGSFRLLVP